MVQNGILNIFNFIVAIIAGFLCERVGRRRLFLTSTVGQYSFFLSYSVIVGIEWFYLFSGMLVFWTLQTACFALYSTTGNTKAAHTVIAMICTFNSLCLIHNDINLLLYLLLKSCFTDSVSIFRLFFFSFLLFQSCWYKSCRWCTYS